MTEEDLFFPSESHRRSLVDKVRESGFKNFTSQERLEYHAYRYGWRRACLKDFEQRYPGDPAGDWWDGILVGRAFEFYGGKLEKRQARPELTPEDIEHVERVCRHIRATLDKFAENSRTPFVADNDGALTDFKRELGLTATAEEP